MSASADDPGGQPLSEEELRAAYEAELSRITATDMIAQAAVSLLNIGAHRLGPPPGAEAEQAAAPARDLEQVRDAIDAVGALLKVLERRIGAQELGPLRDALSRLQMAYAREAPVAAGGAAGRQAGEQAAAPAPAQATAASDPAKDPNEPGPAESSGRLWVPGR